MTPKISIVIVNYKSEDALEHCLRSLHVATQETVEVILVDNSPLSRDHQPLNNKSAERVLQDSGLPGFYFPQSRNTGYTLAANLGARHAHGEYLCFLNPDTVWEQHGLGRLVAWVAHHPRSVAGPRELDPAGKITTSAFPFVTRRQIWNNTLLYKLPWPRACQVALGWLVPAFRYAHLCRHAKAPTRVPVLSGSCILMRRAVWAEIGEWHPELSHFGLESEWFERAQASGVTAWYIPGAVILHEHGLSIRRGEGWRVREAADHNRRWHAAQKGMLTVGILLLILWIERQLRNARRAG